MMRKAFTLIELLTVIAITAIIMTLIIVPVIQSFNLTRAAQGYAEAQDRARRLTERIAREINNAVATRDNTGEKGALLLVVPARPGSGQAVAGYDPNREFVRAKVLNAKLDLVTPFEGDPTSRVGNAFRDPQTGMVDPTLHAPKGQVSLPVAPGMSIVRYWIGLRSPLRRSGGGSLAGYVEPFSGLLQARSGERDNLYVLYRAEVQPYIWSSNAGRFVVNKAYFFDQNRDSDTTTEGPLLDDPSFFDPALPYPGYSLPDPDGTTPDPTKEQMVQNWLRVAVVQTEVSRFDMIQPTYDLRTRAVVYDGDTPRLQPLIQFRPTRVSSEPAEGQAAVRQGEETGNSAALAPDVYRTKYGGWSNTLIRTYPSGYAPGSPAPYLVGVGLSNPGPADPQGFSEYIFDPTSGFEDNQVGQTIAGNPVGVEIFDYATYSKGLRFRYRANFTRAIAAANARSSWLGNTAYRSLFNPYVPDFDRGRVIRSFGIDEVGVVGGAPDFIPAALPDPTYNPNNLPGNVTWPDSTPPLSPMNDPNTTGNFYDAAYTSINKKFNKVWADHPELRPEKIHRYIDLRVTATSDGAPSPLNPDPATGFSNASIVPGSEQVYGPDQNPGPNYGNVVRYTRTTREPGPNQYRINYTDLQEPTDYGLFGLPNPPVLYTPNNFSSAVFQPRFKAGYVQFNSDPNVPLPGDNPVTPQNEALILVYYRFQFSRPNDVVAVDYDSRQLMSVLLTIRNFPQSTIPNPQQVTLRSTATVRNFLR